MRKFAQWYVDHFCDILGWVAVILGLFTYKETTESCIMFVGGIVLWGMQTIVEEVRKERTIKFEPANVEK